jgi:hypothetical protein
MANSFLYLLICHFIGDYYLQTSALSTRKRSEFEGLLFHSVFYMIPFLSILFLGTFYSRFDTLFFLGVIWMTHFLVDALKSSISRRFTNRQHEEISYLLDQVLHLLILYGISVSLFRFDLINLGSNIIEIQRWVLYILLILKPANVTFRIVFARYQSNDADDDSIRGAGTMIGSLERLLMALMIGLQQFSAIGLVLTAKSIARYDKISKRPAFAEYFLIGTLYSTIATVLLYILLFRVI